MVESLIKPIHDNKVDAILKGLTEGKTREELATELKYKNYKGLDIYMRRKNWRWNSKTVNYETVTPKLTFEDELNKVKITGTSIGKVIEIFDSGIDDPMEVAKMAGFRNHVEMAEHMKKNNYVWDNEKGNYVMKIGKVKNSSREVDNITVKESIKSMEGIDINEFIPLLNLLQDNKDKLIENLTPDLQTQSIPTYLVPGVATVLSAQMMSSLKLLLRSYSEDNNVTQRHILEVALIEFFNKYGYSYRVKEMLNA